MKIEVKHDEENQKFYVVIEGKEAHANYLRTEKNVLNFHHTFVPVEFRGQKIAAAIVEYALNFARSKNYKVIPSCSYVRTFIQRHNEYQDLLK